ncbi:protein MutL [Seminavis robusta]|uniref:Protein MutL n=1 Tax=Seminavis robusta TaxID=568900 RepID=A0A9N8F328_9STRA|nr:protein MutL [Seminavis robusta]|eukprot:Sro2629_g333080.1 protein MutL (941) ;mRNA; r:8791-11613
MSSLSASSAPSGSAEPLIRVLPKDVVDRIAAGEVVQRPANALKELLENCLDAGATKVLVTVDKKSGGAGKQMLDFSISDNGHGIGKADLEVAATRFATSKLTNVDDFKTLSSFGFRGEALASISMVSHLTITSKTNQSGVVAHECQYLDGRPQPGHPKQCARTVGTTVKVQDLFYNVPHRLRALKPKDEYTRMLNMMQPYAVHVARRGVGIVVQHQQAKGKTSKTVVDLNTSNLSKLTALTRMDATERDSTGPFLSPIQQEATKQVIKTLYGSCWGQNLLYFQSKSCQEDEEDQSSSSSKSMSYTCEGFLASPSLAADGKVQLQTKNAISNLFVNNRYVECPALKRRLEDTYATLTSWKKPPFIYLTIQVPPNHVDVNVHPTKTQVALLFLEEIVTDVAAKVHELLNAQGQTFGERHSKKVAMPENPYKKKGPARQASQQSTTSGNNASSNGSKKRKQDIDDDYQEKTDTGNTAKKTKQHSSSTNDNNSKSSQTPQQSSQTRRNSSSSSMTQPRIYSHNKIRTSKAAPAGALEPFLVRNVKPAAVSGTPSTAASTPPPSSLSSQYSTTTSTSNSIGESSQVTQQTPQDPSLHRGTCPFASGSSSVDMSQPGAFARASQQCTCRAEKMQEEMASQSQPPSVYLTPQQQVVRPTVVVPTKCDLGSVRKLRRQVQKRMDADLQKKLRKSMFVGVVSQHRSLVQCQEELCLLHHSNLSQALFYQLALAHFGGNRIATFGRPVHVQTAIEQVLQMEEDLQDQKLGLTSEKKSSAKCIGLSGLEAVNETNEVMAKQATQCLWDNAAMLEEYFGIRFELDKNGEKQPQKERESSETAQKVLLMGLPILLEGHAPQPHGLPLFLLRLATEVDWGHERHCFDGVCRELGNYYALLPSFTDGENDNLLKAQVQHALFPALSFLLMPSQQCQDDVKPLTCLPNLYKVFERC